MITPAARSGKTGNCNSGTIAVIKGTRTVPAIAKTQIACLAAADARDKRMDAAAAAVRIMLALAITLRAKLISCLLCGPYRSASANDPIPAPTASMIWDPGAPQRHPQQTRRKTSVQDDGPRSASPDHGA